MMKENPYAQRTPEEVDRKDLTSHGAEDASPDLERIWNAMQPKLAIIDETLEALAHYQVRNGMRRKVKRTLLLVACALLVCGCALATGIKLWDLKVGVIDGTLAISVQRNQNESTLQREAGTGWGDALDQALVEHDIRAAVPKWIPEGFDALDQALVEHDIRAAVPKWIPEGFELADITVDDAYEIVDIGAWYENGEDVIHFSVIQVQESGMIDAFYEMNEESLRTETVGTLEVHFFSNNARNGAAWHEDEYLVYFSGDISEQEVEKMVQSIFSGENGAVHFFAGVKRDRAAQGRSAPT